MLGNAKNEENEENKNDCWLKYFGVKGSTLEACREEQ